MASGKFSMQKDPRVYARGVARKPPDYKRALGIDLGTNCGIAFCDFIPGSPVLDAPVYLDQWDLSIGQYDSGALRHIRLKMFLEVLQPDLIGFEDVKVDVPLDQFRNKPGALVARIVPTAEFIGGLKNTVSVWAYERDIPMQGIPIAAIKKFATGKGNAAKVDMIEACNKTFGTEFSPENYENTGVDNMADAAFILKMMLENYSEGLDGPVQEPEPEAPAAEGASRRKRRTRSAGEVDR